MSRLSGGECEIRTHEDREALPVFKTGAFNRSANSPCFCLPHLPVLAPAAPLALNLRHNKARGDPFLGGAHCSLK